MEHHFAIALWTPGARVVVRTLSGIVESVLHDYSTEICALSRHVGISGTALIRGNHRCVPLQNTRAVNVLNVRVIFDTLRVLGDLSDFAFSAHPSGLPENAVII